MKKHLIIFLMAMAAITATAQTQQQADSIYQLGRNVNNELKASVAKAYCQQAMEMYRTLHGEACDDYINALNALAANYGQEKNFKKAAELEFQVMALCQQLDHQHPRIGLFYENMGYFSYMIDDYRNATQYWELALPYEEKYSDKYGTMIQGMAMMYENLGDNEGLARMMQLMDEHNKHELTLPCEELKCMMERAEYYAGTGDNAQAKEWYLKAIRIAEGEDKIQVYEAYGQFLAMTMKERAQGAEYTLSAANMKKELHGESEDYAVLMYKAGQYSFLGKQFQQAVDCYDQALEYFNKHNTRAAQSNRAKCLKGMGNAYNGLKEFGKAIECFQQALAYYEKYNKDSDEYPKMLERLATAEKFNKEYDAAIEHYQQAMQIFEKRNMMEDYSNAASSIQLCYTYAGMDMEVDTKEDAVKAQRNAKLDQIIQEELDNLQMTYDYLGSLIYAQSLGTIAGCYSLKEDYAEAVNYYKQYMVAIREALQSEFSMQSETERMTTWNQEKTNIQDLKELLVTLPVGNEVVMDSLCALVYDAALLSKGILLNSSIEFEKVLAEQGNEQLKTIYTQIKANDERMEWLRNNAASDADLDKILQLSQENQALQIQLYKGCKELADFTDYISYDWKAVRNAMEATDIAIEFIAIKASPIDNENFMAALVLTKDMHTPIAVPICTLAEVKVMSSFEQLYELDNLVWGNIGKFLQGKERIFFSADGGFNHIGIEYLKYNGKPLSEQFEVYRLSSTKELCYHHHTSTMDRVALFGDINYNEQGTMSTKTQEDLIAMRQAETEFANLSSTKREVNEIQTILKGKAKTITKLTDTEASQTAFLELNNSQVNLLHVATHGAYIASDKSTESESMQNSILAFAGANLYEDTHDGIVTAADIAKMNLRQCDLAVLSACETGLGKLGDDGVFGLQRGFKNAGVHSLLMSIKNVYDNTTANMMISFYRHLAEGFTKREALVKAQQEIRESGYKEAKYWATFILLDALD